MERVDRGADRVPPHNTEAEKSVLSAILLNNAAIHEIAGQLSADDFYLPAHRRLFEAMQELNDANQPVDLTTLSDYLKSRDLLDSIGGPVQLAKIADYEATAANVAHYKDIVRKNSIKRRIIETATEIVNLGFDQAESSAELLDAAESKIFALSQTQAESTLSPLSEAVHDAADHIQVLMNHSGELTGVPTGYPDFDKETGGLQPGDLIVLAARPAMGKTALALNIARNAAVDYGKKVAIFSLEMTTRSLVLRLLAAEAEVDFSSFRSGLIALEAHARLMNAAGRIAEAPIFIDDSGAPSVLEIRAKSRRLHAKERGLDLVIVDYLQLAHGDKNTQSREQEIAEISRGLKGLAKELDIPVLALSQLNRGPETRKEDKRPMLADLRESGAIEQDADVIGFIYRDVVYNSETEHEDLAELIVAKQRNGPTGVVKLKFEGRFARFVDWPLSDDPYTGGPTGGGFVPPPAGSDEPF
ncbi:MAG: replicative DNA helicase [Myxococcota bacterium]|nr:replicative DNA helicase [Myxococcota bacterium]